MDDRRPLESTLSQEIPLSLGFKVGQWDSKTGYTCEEEFPSGLVDKVPGISSRFLQITAWERGGLR